MRPSVQAGQTIGALCNASQEELPIGYLVEELVTQAKTVESGELGRLESMLTCQAHTLDAIFNRMARSALQETSLPQFEAKWRIALKAQSQCRATIETMAEIKNPRPVAFIRQANVANGPQQVNNAMAAEPSRARESLNSPDKLLEHQHGERLDCGTTDAATRADSELETVGAINGTADSGGKGSSVAERVEGRNAPDAPSAFKTSARARSSAVPSRVKHGDAKRRT